MKKKTANRAKAQGKPTKLQILMELRIQREAHQDSFRENDGVIRNPGAIHTLACLAGAIEIISASQR